MLYRKNTCTFQIERTYTGKCILLSRGYKSEGRGFDSRWCHWNFSFT